ncbi:MAG TPA: hypothetical protein VGA33_01510, partial [Thermoanaerobaculia bacterium]
DAPTIAAHNQLDSGIWQHANGSYVTGIDNVWTGSSTPSVTGTHTCTDWSTNSAATTGSFGTSNELDVFWWDGFSIACSNSFSVYCLEP